MDFFSNIAELIDGYAANFTIAKKDDGELIVSVYPKLDKDKNSAQAAIKPLVLTASPEELDQQFFTVVTTPLGKIRSLAEQTVEFAKAADKAVEKGTGKKPVKKTEKPVEQTKDMFAEAEKKVDDDVIAEGKKVLAESRGTESPPLEKTNPNLAEQAKTDTPAEEDVPDNVDTETGEVTETPAEEEKITDDEEW